MTDQSPFVGRMVHYVSYGTPGGEYQMACRAAVITEVTQHPEGGMTAGLAVLNPTGMFFSRDIPCDLGSEQAPIPATAWDTVPEPGCDGRWHAGGTWHWPARADGRPGA